MGTYLDVLSLFFKFPGLPNFNIWQTNNLSNWRIIRNFNLSQTVTPMLDYGLIFKYTPYTKIYLLCATTLASLGSTPHWPWVLLPKQYIHFSVPTTEWSRPADTSTIFPLSWGKGICLPLMYLNSNHGRNYLVEILRMKMKVKFDTIHVQPVHLLFLWLDRLKIPSESISSTVPLNCGKIFFLFLILDTKHNWSFLLYVSLFHFMYPIKVTFSQ